MSELRAFADDLRFMNQEGEHSNDEHWAPPRSNEPYDKPCGHRANGTSISIAVNIFIERENGAWLELIKPFGPFGHRVA